MWLLGRIVPLTLGSFVNPDDQHWENITSTLTITEQLLSQSISLDECDHLTLLIEEHQQSFCLALSHLISDSKYALYGTHAKNNDEVSGSN